MVGKEYGGVEYVRESGSDKGIWSVPGGPIHTDLDGNEVGRGTLDLFLNACQDFQA
ncbi:hypothetical protein D3C76_1877960 [compost metagenome]